MPFWRKDPEPETKEDPKPEPTYATKDEISSLRQEIHQGLDWLRESYLPGLAQQRQPETRPDEPPIRDVSDDDYTQALDNLQNPDFDGNRREALRIIQTRESASRERLRRDILGEVKREIGSIRPQLEEAQETITRQGLNALPYYSLFKKDIDTALAKVPAGQRTMQVATLLHNQLVGSNHQAVIDYEIAERARRAKEAEPPLTVPGRRGTPGQRDAKPTFEDTFGERFSDSNERIHGAPLWDKRSRLHRDPDSFAQARGFDNANDYAEFSHAMMAIEPCPNCFMEVIKGECNCKNINQFNNRHTLNLLR